MQYKYIISIPKLGLYDSDQRDYLRNFYSQSLDIKWWVHKDIEFLDKQQSYSVRIEWTSAIQDIKEHVVKSLFIDEAYQLYYQNTEGFQTLEAFAEARLEKYPIRTTISIFVDTTETNELIVNQSIKNLSQHLFLLSNLACPGILDFDGSMIKPNKERLTLSKYTFEESLTESYVRGWPTINSIPFNIAFDWYNKLGVWNKSIASTNMEKALFAIMNYCSEEKMNPSRLIWIAHAIESLYETPHLSILNSIRERIALFLDIKENKQFKRKVNDFYEYRSKFVHGGLPIAIPSIDFFDETHGSYFNKLFEVERFGLAIIIATVQKLILNNWSKLNFSTTYKGE